MIGVSSLQYVLEEGAKDDWFNSPLITVLSIISAIGLFMFIWWEWHTAHPAVNVKLVMEGNMPIGTILNAVLGLVLMGTVFVFPLFVQIGLGWTPLMTGMFMVPGVLHCGGGPGPSQVDWLGDLDNWVKTGKAPDQVVARTAPPPVRPDVPRSRTPVKMMVRPVCAYPANVR